MDFNFQDENPYSATIVAELVERPRPTTKRHVFLALMFLALDAPFLVMQIAAWWIGVEAIGKQPPLNIAVAFAGGLIFAVPVWWIAFMCVRELVQAARGR